MKKQHSLDKDTFHRAEAAVIAVLPNSVEVQIPNDKNSADLIVNGQPLNIKWAGKGYLGDVRRVLSMSHRQPDIVVASKMSQGACKELMDAGVSWVDETGAAEIVIGLIIVSRTGISSKSKNEIRRWSPSVMAITEALLCGVKATVLDTQSATGLSEGSCTGALKFLANQGLIESSVERGPKSARRVVDERILINAYVSAVENASLGKSIQVGIVGQDAVSELIQIGKRWREENIAWATTGLVAANLVAPLLTSVNSAEVYVSAKTLVGLEAIAKKAELMPIKGGRLTLRPFPTIAVRTMSKEVDEIWTAPWPRVYADLLRMGVRGEDAAEHLWEVIHDR